MDDVIINKLSLLDNYLARVRAAHVSDFLNNQNSQDIATINLIRACEVCLDVGLRIIRIQNLGIPKSNKDIFVILCKNSLISESLSLRLQKMAGFRNIAIHEYEDFNNEVIDGIITEHLGDFKEFADVILNLPIQKE